MSRELRRNASGAKDPTAYYALEPIIKAETEVDRQVHKLIAIIKNIVDLAGFELIARVEFRHKESGREFK